MNEEASENCTTCRISLTAICQYQCLRLTNVPCIVDVNTGKTGERDLVLYYHDNFSMILKLLQNFKKII
jgi:hypothetical protein